MCEGYDDNSFILENAENATGYPIKKQGTSWDCPDGSCQSKWELPLWFCFRSLEVHDA